MSLWREGSAVEEYLGYKQLIYTVVKVKYNLAIQIILYYTHIITEK